MARQALAGQPGSIDHLRLLGRALEMQSRFPEAEETLRRALALAPGRAPLHEDLGGVLVAQRRYGAAS